MNPLFNWLDKRGAGVLLHPSSLPGYQGIGVLGPNLSKFLTFLKAAGIRYWQICPLGPTSYGDSPYQCFSAFAGNPYFVDLEELVSQGLLANDDLRPLFDLATDTVDYGGIYHWRRPILDKAFANFCELPPDDGLKAEFAEFSAHQSQWLPAFSLFMALKDHFGGQPWWEWPKAVRFYSSAVKAALPDGVTPRSAAHQFFQFLFYRQWARVRSEAAALGIQIIGDAPIFVARDSADVWAHPELFLLDPKTGAPTVVAGVPPDYFSADGQLWGNPLYAWPTHAKTKYAWWIDRLRANFELCDIIRIDHFRGFESYWSIPADAPNARGGTWEKGPGLALFDAIRNALPEAKLIAEDLGELTPDVVALREATGLPGMAILQFAFGGDAANLYLPHNHSLNSVVYPGTHDNDTTLGWFQTADTQTQDHVRQYLGVDGSAIGWDFVRSAYRSSSRLAIVPLQDLLSLGTKARMNMPGKAAGNWQWRYTDRQLDALHRDSASYLLELAELYGR